VALCAFLAVAAFFVGNIVASSALGDVRSDSTADRLLAINDDPTQAVILPSILQALTFIFVSLVFLYLFQAVSNRSSSVRRPFLGFYLLAPALIAIQFALISVALPDMADRFASEFPDAEIGVTAEPSPGETSEDVNQDSPEEARADDIQDDSSTFSSAQIVGVVGFLCLGIAMLYAGLWAMRTGLLTRFTASFAMALGVVTGIPLFSGLGLFGTVLLMAYFAIFFIRSPESRPPAWAEGRAIPWPKAGEEPAPASDGTVEGSGREVSERPLPEAQLNPAEETEPESPAPATNGETQGQRRKKRKRRT
jgi:hypothetical protein